MSGPLTSAGPEAVQDYGASAVVVMPWGAEEGAS